MAVIVRVYVECFIVIMEWGREIWITLYTLTNSLKVI